MEIIKSSPDIVKKYNYKKEYEIISALQIKTLNAYPKSHEYTQSLLYNVNNDLKKNKWNVAEFTAKYHNLECKFTRYFTDKDQNNLVIVFDHNNVTKTFYLLQTLVQGLIRENLQNVSVVSMRGNPLCTDYLVNKYDLKRESRPAYIFVFSTNSNTPKLQVVNANEKFSSIYWSTIMPNTIERPGIAAQLARASMPLFKKTVSHEKTPPIESIGFGFSKEIFANEVNSIDTILPPLFYAVKNYVSVAGKLSPNSVWINNKNALSTRGFLILGFFLAILVWLPIANRLYEGESINSIFSSLISALFSSSAFFLTAAIIKLGSLVSPTENFAAFIIPLVFVVFFWIIRKLKRNLFDVNVNSLTEFIVLIVFATLLAFKNTSLLICILPAIFVADKKLKIDSGTFRLLLILSLSPLVYAIYNTFTALNSEDVFHILTFSWFNHVVFSNLYLSSLIFIIAGSLVTINKKMH